MRKLGVTITDDPDKLFREVEADAVIHATTSFLEQTFDQIMRCINAGMNVISTCEELSYPWLKRPELAR